MSRKIIVESVVLLTIAVACVAEGVRLVLRKGAEPVSDVLGPGYYVLVLGVALQAPALLHLRSAQASAAPSGSTTGSMDRWRMAGMAGVLAGYIVLIDLFGYLFSSVLFFLLEFRLFGVKPWPKLLGLTVIVRGIY